MRATIACLSFVLFLGIPAASAELAGRPSVIDGDTIEIQGERVRLHGIDAPESGQWCLDGADSAYRCGQEAAFALADRIGSQVARCDVLDQDRYGRHIGRCFLGEEDVNEWLVRQGQALAYRRFSEEYVPAEAAAREDGLGVWQGQFDWPWEWRRGERTVSFGASGPSDGCRIKGNISRNGRIYHLPGQQHYDRTGIDEDEGERWFCSEGEAQVAGWRKAKR